jgi:hypothetical protein
VWIDSDAWVQDWSQIVQLAESAKGGEIAIVREEDHGGVDMSVPGPNGPERVRFTADHLRATVFESYQLAFGPETAEKYGRQLPFNSGVFALSGDSPVWSVWAATYASGLDKIRGRLTGSKIRQQERCVDQNSLTLAIDQGKIAAQLMPSTMNWQFSYGFPAYDSKQGAFVVPSSGDLIGVVHLVDFKRFLALPILHTVDNVVRDTPIQYLPHLGFRRK